MNETSYGTHAQLKLRNTSLSTISGFKTDLLADKISPLFEKSLFAGTDVAGLAKNFLARIFRLGNCWPSVAHHSSGQLSLWIGSKSSYLLISAKRLISFPLCKHSSFFC
jgi:hypothetical protein